MWAGQSGPDKTIDENVGNLSEKAQNIGSVRVIVMLDTPFQPEGQLDGLPAVESQRLAVQRAQDILLAYLPGYDSQSVKKFSTIPAVALAVNAEGLAALASNPNVVSIQEDWVVPATLAESTPLIGATDVWASGYTGEGQTVAILDTGVDKTHPFLTNKVVSEACYSTNDSSYNSVTVCPGGVSQSTATGSAMPYGGVCPSGECDHGTHVAGIAAGKDNGSIGFNGVAKNASIIAVQVFSKFPADQCDGYSACVMSYTSDQILGLERVYDLRDTYEIAAVNMSLGGGKYTSQTTCDSVNAAIKQVIDNLRSVGIATVIASGNNGYTDGISSPGCVSSAVSVGSTGDGSDGATADVVSYYSNSISFLDLLAPGQWITSSTPNGGYDAWSGTSMATPHVVGAWALLKSKYPSATVDQIQNFLVLSGKSITDSRNGVKTPRINVKAALDTKLYTVSGRVAVDGSTGLEKVLITMGSRTALTDSNGDYQFTDVLAGSYSLVPSKSKYAFVPASIGIVVTGEVENQNFAAALVPLKKRFFPVLWK